MIGVKDAVRSSTEFIKSLYPVAGDIRLEEVEKISSQWSVVLSFRIDEPSSALRFVVGEQRLFKTVIIDAENGQATAVKIWGNG